MKRKFIGLVSLMLVFLMAASAAFAIEAGEKRVIIGADLSAEQRLKIYQDFNIEPGTVTELLVTNTEERTYLEGLVPDGKIGNVALSCLYIETLPEGSGLDVTVNNVNWCSQQMYVNALLTAGITDAKVMVSAPFRVSGTAALTAAYKAYEDITGETLSLDSKNASTQELIITGNLAEVLGDVDATELVNELKKVLSQTKDMTDDQLRQEILSIAQSMNIALTDAQVSQLVSLCRSLEKLDLSQLTDQINSIAKAVTGASKAQTFLSSLGESIRGFFTSVGNFFSRLFG